MRLIDADALKEELVKRTPHFVQRIEFTPCFEAIRNAPTVDAVPVDELKNRDVRFHDKGKAFDVFFPIGLDLDSVNKIEIRGRKFVPVKSIEQLKWERDTAIQQLEEHGIPFCGKSDVVAVVRCKDCKYYEPYSDSELGNVIGVCDINPMGKAAFAHWYCADGERKDDGND